MYVGDPQTLQPADHWEEIEIDQLRADIEEAEMARVEAEDRSDKSLTQAREWHRKFDTYKAKLDSEQSETNTRLRDKLMLYLSLINEYEISINHFVKMTRQPMLNEHIINGIRKRGGLSL